MDKHRRKPASDERTDDDPLQAVLNTKFGPLWMEGVVRGERKPTSTAVFVEGDSLQFWAKKVLGRGLDPKDIRKLIAPHVREPFEIQYYVEIADKESEKAAKKLSGEGLRIHIVDRRGPWPEHHAEDYISANARDILPVIKHLVLVCGSTNPVLAGLLGMAKSIGCETIVFSFSTSKKVWRVADYLVNIKTAWIDLQKPTPDEPRKAGTGTVAPSILRKMDVAILVPLEEEFEQLFPYIKDVCKPEKDPRTNRSFYTFRREGASGAGYNCVTTFVGDMGPQGAASLTRRLIERYEPRTLVLLGIAGGLGRRVRLCDVVVADQIDDYLARAKAGPDGDGLAGLQLSGKVYRPDVRIVNTIKSFKFDHPELYARISAEGRADLETLGPIHAELIASRLVADDFGLHCGPVASGDIVSASKEFSAGLLARDRKYQAVEMEAAGVMGEIYLSAGNERVMVLRGISDLSDERKAKLDETADGSLRAIALRNAIRLLWSLFEIGAFEQDARIPEQAAAPEQTPDLGLEELAVLWVIRTAKRTDGIGKDVLKRLDEMTKNASPIPSEIAGILNPSFFPQIPVRSHKGQLVPSEPLLSDPNLDRLREVVKQHYSGPDLLNQIRKYGDAAVDRFLSGSAVNLLGSKKSGRLKAALQKGA